MTRLDHRPVVGHEPTAPTATDVPLALEAIVYLASIATAIGATFVVSRFWDRLGHPGRLGIALAVAAVGFVGWSRLERLALESFGRMATGMWVVGTAGVALGSGIVAHWVGADGPDVIALVAGIPILVLGLAEWHNEDRVVGMLVSVGGLMTILTSCAAMLDVGPELGGALLWVGSTAALLAALDGVIHPRPWAGVVASIGMFIGASAFAQDGGRDVIWVALASALFVVALGAVSKCTPILVVGLLQFAMTLPNVLGAYLHGLGAALGLLIVGLVILAIALPRLVRRAHRLEPPASGPGL